MVPLGYLSAGSGTLLRHQPSMAILMRDNALNRITAVFLPHRHTPQLHPRSVQLTSTGNQQKVIDAA